MALRERDTAGALATACGRRSTGPTPSPIKSASLGSELRGDVESLSRTPPTRLVRLDRPMVKKVLTIVELTDDLDGGKADQTVLFTWQGVNYEIDLSKKNAAALQKALKPYLDAARKVKSRGANRASGGSRSGARRSDLADVREWARANGHTVSDRGRIPASVLDAYDDAR